MKEHLEQWTRNLRRHGLYRDRERGLFFGVCAGMAERFGWSLAATRVAAALGLVLFFLPTALVYVTAGMLLPDKPLTYYGQREARLWGRHSRRGGRHYA